MDGPTPMSRRAFLVAGGATALGLAACRREVATREPLSLPSVGASLPRAEPTIRVRIERRTTPTPFNIGRDGDRLLLEARSAGRTDGLAFVRGPVRLQRSTKGWSAIDASERKVAIAPGADEVTVTHLDPDATDPIGLDDGAYPGQLHFVAMKNPARVDVVNHVPLESYLPGVLHKELFSHWHPETFAAQAIAARTFACTEHEFYRAKRHFDLVDTAASQVYGGVTDAPKPIEAVERTRGVLLTTKGTLVPGYYSSCCGGLAADARDVIGPHPWNDCAPLRGAQSPDICTKAPVYRWNIERTLADVELRLIAYGRDKKNDELAGLNALRTIVVAERNQHGRPKSYEVNSRSGSTTVDAAVLRRALDTEVAGARPGMSLKSAFLTLVIDEKLKDVEIDGRGFGHGAGLCQYGAEAHARAGRRADAIVEWYYPSVELRQAWGGAAIRA